MQITMYFQLVITMNLRETDIRNIVLMENVIMESVVDRLYGTKIPNLLLHRRYGIAYLHSNFTLFLGFKVTNVSESHLSHSYTTS